MFSPAKQLADVSTRYGAICTPVQMISAGVFLVLLYGHVVPSLRSAKYISSSAVLPATPVKGGTPSATLGAAAQIPIVSTSGGKAGRGGKLNREARSLAPW